MPEITKRFETDEQEGKKTHHAAIAAHWILLHNHFHAIHSRADEKACPVQLPSSPWSLTGPPNSRRSTSCGTTKGARAPLYMRSRTSRTSRFAPNFRFISSAARK